MDAYTLSLDELIAEASAALEAHARGRPLKSGVSARSPGPGAVVFGQLGQVRGALSAALAGDCGDELYSDACEIIRAIDELIAELEARRLVRRAS